MPFKRLLSYIFLSHNLAVEFLRGLVREEKKRDADNRLENAQRRSVTEVEVRNAKVNYVLVQNRGDWRDDRIAQKPLLFKTDVDYVSDIDYEQSDDCISDSRKRDMPNLLPTVAAVDYRRFVQLLVDAGDGGNINDGVPARFLPNVGNRDNPPKEPRLFHKSVWCFDKSEVQESLVYHASRRKRGRNYVGNYYP